jgi:hypothetical protein
VFLPEIRWAVFCFEQILDRVVTLLIVMRNLEEPTGQKGVNDRSKKNEGRNKVERFPLDPPRQFSEELLQLVVDGKVFLFAAFLFKAEQKPLPGRVILAF